MHTGVISSENLSQVLQGISRKRQQGILEVTLPNKVVQIFFVQGKVVEVIGSDAFPVTEVLESLKLGGLVPHDVEENRSSYQDLFEWLNGDPISACIDRETFANVIRHRVLDRLYCLDFGGGAYYNFKVQMVEVEKDFTPSISVGQLLLDLVSLEADRERFADIFDLDTVLSKAEFHDLALSDEEQAVADALGTSKSVGEVIAQSMLSTFHACDVLLGLYDRELISILQEDEQAGSNGGQVEVDDIVAALEHSLDESFGSNSGKEQFYIPESQIDRAEGDSSESTNETPKVVRMSPRMALGIWSVKLLQAEWVPGVAVLIFLAAALSAPFLWWQDVIEKFSRF